MGFDEWLQGRQMQVELNQQLNQLEQTRLLEEQNRLLRQQKVEQPRSQNSETKCPYCASPVNQSAALCPSCHLPFFGFDLDALAFAVKENPDLVLPENLNAEKLREAIDASKEHFHAHEKSQGPFRLNFEALPSGAAIVVVHELLVSKGSLVKAGQSLMSVQTPKRNIESILSPIDGQIKAIFGYPGAKLVLGSAVAVIDYI